MKLLVAAVLCCFAVSAQAASRIVGGADAPDGKYPFVVSLKVYNTHVCTASIISKRVILTAAHCVGDPENLYSVKVGSNDQSDPQTGALYEVEKFVVHEKYNGYDHDIALVYVTEDIAFGEKVQPIALVNHDLSKAGYPVTAMGWGESYVGSGAMKMLQEVSVNLVEQNECKDAGTFLQNWFICTLKQKGEGICRGDSGGPLVADGVQVGVASKAVLCARGYPDVFVRVHHYLDWINERL